jgi:hypothetical protein
VKVRGPSTPTPENATAVVVNVTATQASAASYLTVYPSGSARPLASNLNFPAGGTVPNLVVSRIGTDGRVCIYNYAGSVHVILDIVGFFTVEGAGSRFVGITPYRRYDSRSTSPWGPDQSYWLTVRGGGLPVPANATAVVMNVTVTQPTATGYLTVHPSQQPRPTASNLNFTPGRTVPNLVTVKIGSNGGVDVYNSAGNTHVVLDIVGYYL